MVEKWLIQVEEVMIKSLMKVTEDALQSYLRVPRDKWVQDWPGQVEVVNFYTYDVGKFSIIIYCA